MIARIQKFLALPHTLQWLFVRSYFVLTAVRIKLWLGSPNWREPALAVRSQPYPRHTPREIAWAVRAVSPYVPRATCLAQALAAERMLAQCGHTTRLHIGVAQAIPLDAHAWLECDGQALLGAADAHRYRTLFSRAGSFRPGPGE